MKGFAIAVFGFLALAPAAQAGTIYAGPPSQFFTSAVTIDQGETVAFTNLDAISHDVTAVTKGADGKALFSTPLQNPGGTADVAGTQYLTAGSYDFGCSIHPSMKGTLTVSSAGTPAARPGSSSGSTSASPQSSPASSDTTKPKVQLHLVDTTLKAVRKRGAIRIHVATDEPVTIGMIVRRGKTKVAATTTKVGASGKTVAVKLTKAGRKLVRKRSLKLSMSARAADGANNKVSTKGSFSLA
jgi:plastocyanin